MIKREFFYLGWYFLLSIPIIIFYIRFSRKTKREWLTLSGEIKPRYTSQAQQRKYIRLNTAFPVEFQKIEDGKDSRFDIYQGYTRDISRTGMRIETLTVHGKELKELVPDETKLKLIVNIPSKNITTVVTATIRWINKVEDTTVNRYSIGVSFDEAPGPDLGNIIKHALWFKSKPELVTIAVIVGLILVAALFSTIIIFNDAKSGLEKRLRATREESMNLRKESEAILKEKEELEDSLEAIYKEHTALLSRLEKMEGRMELAAVKKREASAVKEIEAEEVLLEESALADKETAPRTEETEAAEAVEEVEDVLLEPEVKLRSPEASDDDIVVKPNITRRMIKSEKDVYNTLRYYLLGEEIQLLDRYCSTHKASIYHAAGLFALAEMRYKNRSVKEMSMKAYRDVIRLYPTSKYASYASHRLDQIEKNQPYESRTLRYLAVNYNLPALFDYRELEPYKKE